jgi:hypothetical protein
MKISVRTNKNVVQVWIDTDTRVDKPVLAFKRSEQFDYQAVLVAERIRRQIDNLIRDAYNLGFDDCKKKKAGRRKYPETKVNQ